MPLSQQAYERKNYMKLLTSLLALTALFLTASAFAQEESPSPTPSDEEKASTTIETSPEATRSPSIFEATPAATSSPVEKKEQASPTGTSEAKKKQTVTSAENAKPAAETATKSGKKMSPEAAIKENENRWEAAIGSHDVATIEGFVASDFMGISAKGKFLNRSGLLSETKHDKDTYKSAKIEKLNIRAYDKDVAVATGSAREKGTDKDGKAFDRTYLFTDTWVDRNGQWQCVASQVTLRGEK
jgi:ketosteroid isomerase-like protein